MIIPRSPIPTFERQKGEKPVHKSRLLSATIVAAISAVLGGCLYRSTGPAWAGSHASGTYGSPDGGTYGGGAQGSPDGGTFGGPPDHGTYGGPYGSPDHGTYGGPYGSSDRGTYGGAYGSPDRGTYGGPSRSPGEGPYGGANGRANGGADRGGYGRAHGWTGGAAQGIEADPYNPVINPRDFVSWVNNRYFTLRPGAIFTYEKRTPQGTERTEIEVTGQKRKVMGVLTTVVRHRAWLNGQLKEDARDWYAQDRWGNVWYFGEEVDNYENGRLKDHQGSWEAGVNGAKPGIVMLNEPRVGLTYRQEHRKGQAEDMGTVIALDRTVRVASGTFHGCLQTRDWSLIDRTANEYKYYCPQVGFVAFEETAPGGGNSSQLVSASNARANAFNARRSAFKAHSRAVARRDRDGDRD
jgi:hypothetical protein